MNNGYLKMYPAPRDGVAGRGKIVTLAAQIGFAFEKNESRSENAPAFNVVVNVGGQKIGIGAAWSKKFREGEREGEVFYSLSVDDPSFPSTLNVAAFPTGEVDEDGAHLFDIKWNRPRQDRDAA